MSAVQSMSWERSKKRRARRSALARRATMALVRAITTVERDGGEEPAGQRRVAGRAFDDGQGDRVDGEQPGEVGDRQRGAGRSRRRSGSPRRRSSRTGRRRRRSRRSAGRSAAAVAARTRWVATSGTRRARNQQSRPAAAIAAGDARSAPGCRRRRDAAARARARPARRRPAAAPDRARLRASGGCAAPPAFSVSQPTPIDIGSRRAGPLGRARPRTGSSARGPRGRACGSG